LHYVHHTTHGTPTRKKENRNSRGKRKNVKRRKWGKTGYNNTHTEYARGKVDDAQGRDEIK
jgi:hypothetical protein